MVSIGNFLNTITPFLQIGFRELIQGYVDGKTKPPNPSGNVGAANGPNARSNPDKPVPPPNPHRD